MTNEHARTFGHSILGLTVFDRSALHAEAIGRCDRRAACWRGWQTSSVLTG
jgi:hypothetical protein